MKEYKKRKWNYKINVSVVLGHKAMKELIHDFILVI